MGQYDNISKDQLRADLVGFAELLLRLDQEDGLLTSPADLQKILGELRQKLFAWEIRSSHRLKAPGEEGDAEAANKAREDESPTAGGPGAVSESLRVVREALRREQEMIREWSRDPDPETDDRH
jgi:hypothetical protein